ncbi:MAG: isochorismate synthase [Actinobacteria bacterium]|jgi:menaquinone-specific isochorismate synthase|nr:isochorismate synthase [Actinomycetota bacterium]NCW47214.1 isochorismate synthase [Actinomycetota bacterium]
MHTSITTELLGEHPALLDIAIPELSGDQELTSWVRGGDGLIGIGIYKRHVVKGSNRFAEARKWWRNEISTMEIHNNVHGTGTGPILFSSFSFDSAEESILVIPQVVIGQRNGKSWITWIGAKPQPGLQKAAMEKSALNLNWSGSNGDVWQDRVARAVEKIKGNQLEKVVLARFATATTNTSINPRNLLRELANEYPSTWVYSNTGLVGATPELLVRLSKSLVTSRILAGTIRKTGDDERDLALAGSLARSSKDLEEHEYAVRSVADALAPLCSSTNVPESPFVLHLSNVMHLATDVTGVLSDNSSPADIFDLVARLHPSAAVCGTPTEIAQRTIDEIEGISRGRYAGPIGWIDANGDGELGIALRCGQISGDAKSIRIYAGCGIVAGSDPEREYAESQAKLLPMRSALENH